MLGQDEQCQPFANAAGNHDQHCNEQQDPDARPANCWLAQCQLLAHHAGGPRPSAVLAVVLEYLWAHSEVLRAHWYTRPSTATARKSTGITVAQAT